MATRVAVLGLGLFGTPAVFHAQSGGPSNTVAFAELTHGQRINALALDPAGFVWFAGDTCSTTLPTTPDALQPAAPAAQCSGMLGRMTADGVVTYLSYLGGSDTTNATALAVDAEGNVYVGGRTLAPDFPVTPGAFDQLCGSDGTCLTLRYIHGHPFMVPASDGYVVKLGPTGNQLVYSTYIGGGEDDRIAALAVDAAERVHIAGATTSSDFPVTPSALQSSWSFGVDASGEMRLEDAFYARLSADGSSLEYGTYLGGAGEDRATSIALNPEGDAFVAGGTQSGPGIGQPCPGCSFPTLNAAQPENHSARYPWNIGESGWLARFTASGPQYSTFLGGSGTDYVNGLAASDTSLYLVGLTSSPDFPGDSSTFGREPRAFITTVSAATGAVQTTAILHSAGGLDFASAIALDQNGLLYVTGETGGTAAFPITPDAYQPTFGGVFDAFFSILNVSSPGAPVLTYSTYLGGPNEEQGLALTLDAAGGAYFGGLVFASSPETQFPSFNAQAEPPAEQVTPLVYGESWLAHVTNASGGTGGPLPPAGDKPYDGGQRNLPVRSRHYH